MKILIAGASSIGTFIAKYLHKEDIDITILDSDVNAIKEITDSYPVAGIVGDCLSLNYLRDAGISNTDMLIATTPTDSENILLCIIGQMFDVQTKLAYLQNPDLLENRWQNTFKSGQIPVNETISPIKDILASIKDLISYSYLDLSTMMNFADGALRVFSLFCDNTSNIINKPISTISSLLERNKVRSKVVGIVRDNVYMIPLPTDTIKLNDKIFISSHDTEIQNTCNVLKNIEKLESKILDAQNPNVIITGNSPLIKIFATNLANTYKKVYVVSELFENDENGALAIEISKNPNIKLIADNIKNINEQTAYFKSSDDIVILINKTEEETLLQSLILKSKNIHNIFTFLDTKQYEKILFTNQIKHLLIAEYYLMSTVISNIRRGIILNLYSLDENNEIIEFLVSNNSHAVGKKVSDIEVDKGIIVAAIFDSQNNMLSLNSDITLDEDYAVIIVTNRRYIPEIENIFSYITENNI